MIACGIFHRLARALGHPPVGDEPGACFRSRGAAVVQDLARGSRDIPNANGVHIAPEAAAGPVHAATATEIDIPRAERARGRATAAIFDAVEVVEERAAIANNSDMMPEAVANIGSYDGELFGAVAKTDAAQVRRFKIQEEAPPFLCTGGPVIGANDRRRMARLS